MSNVYFRLLKLRRHLVSIAGPVGPLHCYWDYISDIDFRLAGKKGLSRNTDEELILEIEQMLDRNNQDEK
jgi:hypothetical protein